MPRLFRIFEAMVDLIWFNFSGRNSGYINLADEWIAEANWNNHRLNERASCKWMNEPLNDWTYYWMIELIN